MNRRITIPILGLVILLGMMVSLIQPGRVKGADSFEPGQPQAPVRTGA